MNDLYIIENIYSLQVKIGSSDSVKNRIGKINSTSGIKHKILLNIPSFGKFETPLHRCFKPLRTIGEWFKYNGVLKSYISFLENGNTIKKTHLEYIYILFSRYGTNPPNHNFEELMHDVSKDYDSALNCYNQILKEREGIGSEIKPTFLTFLDKKKIVFRHFSYHLTKNGNKYVVIRKNNFDETNPPDDAVYQLHDMNCNISQSYKKRTEKDLQDYINQAPTSINIIEKKISDISTNEKKIILEYKEFDYLLDDCGTAQLIGMHNDFPETNKMIFWDLPYNHLEALTFLETNNKVIRKID